MARKKKTRAVSVNIVDETAASGPAETALEKILAASPEDYASLIAEMRDMASQILRRARTMLSFPLAEQQKAVAPDGTTTILINPVKGWSASDVPAHVKTAIECAKFAVGFDAALNNPEIRAVLDRATAAAKESAVPTYEFPGLTANPFGEGGEPVVDLPPERPDAE